MRNENRILPLPFSFLLVDHERVVKKTLLCLFTVLRGNYLLNFCSKKEQEVWNEPVKVLHLFFSFLVHFSIMIEVWMSLVFQNSSYLCGP